MASNRRYLVAGDFSEINNVVQPGIALIVAHVDGVPVVTMPTNQTTAAGLDFDLTANVDCPPDTTFQWIRNGIAIAGATNSTLEFRNPRLSANGEYQLIAQNQFGSTTSGVTVVSLAMPPTMPGRNDIDFYPDRSIYPYIRAMALQEDGKVVLSLPRSTNNLVRLNLDGSLDTSFVITNRFYSPTAIVAHEDGRLLVVDYETVRLLENGSADPSFNTMTNYETRVVAVQHDGKYILASAYPPGTFPRYIVRRFTSSGDLDTTWIAHQLDSYVDAIAVRPDGKVLVGGYFTNLSRGSTQISWPGRLVQFHPDGSLDTNFVPRFPSAYNAVLALAIESQGTVLAGGFFSAYAGFPAAANLVRLLSNGAPDLSLSGAASNTIVEAIAVQPDGKIVIATGPSGAFLATKGVVRLHQNGTHDATFDAGLGPRRNGAPVGALYLALTPRGKIYAGGYFYEYDGFARPGLVRIHGNPEMPAPFPLGSAFQTSIYTDLGRTYSLETATTTYFTNWSVVHSLSGNASTQTLSDPNPATPPQFYRLRVE